ncbi:hypothetical protein FA13DRAFT_1732737 [Coprinellus micaceus]|uniref:Phosphatidylinositol N-acetylglucosaminyltransferase subunit H conserved domain-containing protein n=1 Tax=Coprinellus micaceus TaxID=71717 RepID=A0A4Y7TBA7_COPMI|nr:hypothetical protein FA13DRAFT_1732737 [Coprinellus micaceus]
MFERTQPLHDTHPQFSTLKTSTFYEFKVENWKPAPNGSGKLIRPYPETTLALVVLALAWWGTVRYTGLTIGLWLIVQHVLLGVLHECVVVFPQHGIQLETHKGFKGLVLSSSRKFIPFANLDDVVINEALYGWNVRYYIVALTRAGNGETVLKVAFPNLLPHFPILKKVYTEMQSYIPRTTTMNNGFH